LARRVLIAKAALVGGDAADEIAGGAAERVGLPAAAAVARDEDARLVDAVVRLDVGEHGAEVRLLGRVGAGADRRAAVVEAAREVREPDLDRRVRLVDLQAAARAAREVRGVA